jgi:hypothetical protein
MTYDFDDFLTCSPEELSVLDRIAEGELLDTDPIIESLLERNIIDNYLGKPMMAFMVSGLWKKFKETYPEKFKS